MSTSSTISNFQRDERRRLEELIRAAEEARKAQERARENDRFQAIVEKTSGDEIVDLEGLLEGAAVASHVGGSASLDLLDVDLGRDAVSRHLPAAVEGLTGQGPPKHTHRERDGRTMRRRARSSPSIEVVWTELDLLQAAVRELDCVVEARGRRWKVTYRDQPLLDILFGEHGRARVSILRDTGAVLLERLNQLYLQSALERHGVATGCRVERRRDGSLVVRPGNRKRARASNSPAARPGTVEVDFAGFGGRSCQQALRAITEATGVQVVRNAPKPEDRRREIHLRQGGNAR